MSSPQSLAAFCAPLAPAERIQWDARLAALAARVPVNAERPRVYVEEHDRPPRAVAEPWPSLLRILGADPFTPPPSSQDRDVSWEELLEFDPQWVLYAIPGQGLRFDPQGFMRIEGWNATEAAKAGRLFSADDQAFYADPLPRLALAEQLQDLIGELFWGWPPASRQRLR